MPHTVVGEAHIHYRIAGDPEGFPVLLIAPGGMSPVLSRWANTPWDPLTQSGRFHVITMDQRNAGGSGGRTSWGSSAMRRRASPRR